MSQGTLVKLSTACSRKSKLCELRSKGQSAGTSRLQGCSANGREDCTCKGLGEVGGWNPACPLLSKGSVYPTAKGMLPEMRPPFRECSHKRLLLFVSLHHQAFYACSGCLLSFAQKHHVNEQKSLKYGQITENHASYFKGFRLEGWSVRSHWEFLDSGVIWPNKLFHSSCIHGRLEPRDSGSYCSCPGMKRKGRFDGIHGNRKGKIRKLFWRQKQQDLITDWTWVYERGGNKKGLRGFELGSYENKSEMEMLIKRAALRGKTESLGEGVLHFTSWQNV